MLFFQIVALFRELNIWAAAAGAAIVIALALFEIRRHTAPKDCQPSDTFLRDRLDW